MTEVFDKEGILIGWRGEAYNRRGEACRCFVPRRDEDVAEDRAAIRALIRRCR